MSAGKNAIPLWKENPEWKNSKIGKIKCQNEACGHICEGYELLSEPDSDMLYCPICRTAGWKYCC